MATIQMTARWFLRMRHPQYSLCCGTYVCMYSTYLCTRYIIDDEHAGEKAVIMRPVGQINLLSFLACAVPGGAAVWSMNDLPYTFTVVMRSYLGPREGSRSGGGVTNELGLQELVVRARECASTVSG